MKIVRNLAVFVVVVVAIFAIQTLARGKAPTPAYFDTTLTLEAALARARDQSRPVLALATADWCGYCQKLKRGALADAGVSQAIQARVVPLYLDATSRSSPGAEAVAALGVRGFPTMILLAPDGTEVSRLSGFVGPQKVLEWLNAAIPAG